MDGIGWESAPELVRRIASDSAGLPLFAVELLDAVHAGLELDGAAPWPATARTFNHTRPGTLPDPLVAAIRVSFGRLGADARAVLGAAAALGDRVGEQELESATRLPRGRLASALDALEWERWLVSEPRGYSFVARVVREVVARDMLTPGQQARIRAAAAGRSR